MSRGGRFLDSLRLLVKGGAGGMGLPKYGGVGGKGGDVYVQTDKSMNEILFLKKSTTFRKS